MAQLIHGTTINGHIAIHAGNLADHSLATTSYVTTQINNLINGAPGALDTLDELAAALGDDASFASTLTNSLAGKLSLSGGTMTGNINWSQTDRGLTWGMNTDGAYIKFFNTGDGDADSRLEYSTSDNGDEYHRWMISGTEKMTLKGDGLRVANTIYASGGNSSNWNTAYGWGNHAGLYSTTSHNHDGRYLLLSGGTLTGDLLSTHPLYPGYNNGAVGSQGSYYLYGATGNSGIRTNGNFLANGDIYLGTRGQWLSTYLNQNVRTDSAPSFSSVYLGGSQLTGTQVNGLSNMLGVTTLPYSCDITVGGDPDRFYAVQFWGGDQDVWRRIIIKRGYGETAPWDPIGTGVHHGGLLLDWEGNFGGWGGAEYADRLRVFNESYTNVCADMFIYSHSMGYVFMLRGGGAVYHLFSDQPINGFYQSGAPDILLSSSTLSYDDAWSGTNQYDVYAPAPLGLNAVNSSRIDGLRLKKQSLLDGRYLIQGSDISGISTISATNFRASNAFYLNGTSYYLNSSNGGIYTNARFESASTIYASGGNSGNWNTAYGWGNHASAGYLTSLPSHNHDDRYYTESESDSRYIVKGSTQLPGSWPEATKFKSSGDIGTNTSGNHALQIFADDGNDAFMAFHISSDFATFFGLENSTNRLYTGGWSDGNAKYQLWDSRDFSSTNISNWNTAYGWGNHSGLYAATSHTHDDRYYTESESDSRFVNESGDSMSGSLTLGAGAAYVGTHGAWTGEQNKIQWHSSHLYLQNTGGGSFFFRRADGSNILTLDNGGSLTVSGGIYPSGNGSYYLYQANSGLWTNGNFGASGDLYLGTRSTWLSSWLNQSVQTGANPTFGEIYVNGKYSYFGSSSGWDSGSLNGQNGTITNVHFQGHQDFWIGAGNTQWYTSAVGAHHDLLINTMQSGGSNVRGITFTASSGGASVYRLGRWHSGTSAITSYLNLENRLAVGVASYAYSLPSATVYVKGSTDGAEVLAVDGVNGRLFTVTDSVLDTIYSVNTIAGLPILEILANSTVKIGKYGSNSITISNSRIAINSDTVDTNFPFYVSDRSTSASRYTLANPGMGFNLADAYAQLQLYGTSGAYIDFVTGANDYNGRIIWASGRFTVSGAMWGDMYNTSGTAYITSSSLSGYATQSWVQSQGYRTTDSDSQTLSLSGNTLSISGGNSVTLSSSGISQATADGLYQPLENQRLRTSDAVTFTNVYNYGWFRNYNTNEGVYNQATGTHFYSSNGSGWTVTGSGGVVELVFRSNHQSTIRGYVYADTSNNIGFLNNAGNWSLLTDSARSTTLYGNLTVGQGVGASSIFMHDSDEGTREIHCNSNRIGFLNQSGSWGSWCDDSGNWVTGAGMYAAAFYDNDNSAFYLDPAGSSRIRNLYVGDSGSNWSDPGGWGTQVWFSNAPHTRFVVEARTPGIQAGIYVHTPDQVYIGSYTGHNVSIMRGGNRRLLIEDGRVYSDVYMEAAGSMRSPIFYDSADTGYYVDPNGTSNLWKFSEATLNRNSLNSRQVNSPWETRSNQGVLYQTGAMGWGTVDLNVVGSNWGSGFIDTWTNPGNAPGGSSHYVGMQAMHYSNSDSARFHGWQMVCAQEANNRWFWRSAWDTPRSWVEMIHSGNIGSQSVSYASSAGNADTVDGWHRDDLRNPANFTNQTGMWTSDARPGPYRLYRNEDNSAYNVQTTWSANISGYWSLRGYYNDSYHAGCYVAYSGYADSAGSASSASSAARATRANGNFYIDDNYGNTVVGVYASTRLQGVWAMGDAYKLSADGTSASNHYGIAWSHPNHGGTAARLTNHGMLIQGAGTTWAAISDSIWCIGDITAYSDARVKANVEVIDNPLDRLSKVRGVTFTRTDLPNTSKRYAGVIAQEMREALPEVVTEDGNGELSVSYGNTVSLLIESIKAQQVQIEELKAEVKKLRGE
jgi:hypothetical protein